mmetsp:Transcript_11699/g.17918  ORF Transcript_11699/g.17918 Transcript_11699/m.17918 type:complete len:850 (+) Transcript_11699:140-2689(+)
MGDNTDVDLGAPLLAEHNHDHDITLNGDSINLRDLLLGGNAALDINREEEQTSTTPSLAASDSSSDNKNIASNKGVEKSSPTGSTTDPSYVVLSLDDNRSSFTATDHHVTQSIRRGRSVYYRAKRHLSNIVAALKRTRNENYNISDVHDGKNGIRQITQKSSLSSSKSTSPFLKLLIPPLLIFNHFIFYQAQTKPMWNLAYSTNVTITATATTLKSKAAFDTLNLPHEYTFKHNENKIVETFTYMDAIRKLWNGEGLGDAQTLSKVAAALLIVFSGIWPHFKLILVHFCWFFPFSHSLLLKSNRNRSNASYVYDDRSDKQCCKPNEGSNSIWCANGYTHKTHNRRSPFLRVLSTLGKWSLADVLVVCILIAVLHLDWKVNPHEIRSGVENELPTILQYVKGRYPDVNNNCEQLLGYPCEVGKALVIHYPQCFACKTLMSNAYNHPDWTTSEGKDIMEGIDLGGGGYAQLRVMGMTGTYFFCAAAMMSILLSLLVDVFDEKDRKRVEDDLIDKKSEIEFILPGEEGYDIQRENETVSSPPSSSMHPPWNAFHQRHHTTPSPLQFATNNPVLHPPIPSPTTNSHLLKYVIMCLLSLISLPFVCYAVTLPTMERLVYGGGPRLLHEVVGMEWEQEYSLITLVKTTGDAGGWDKFLMLTFGMFVVVGPIIRAVCLTLHACLGIPVALLQDCIERPRHRTTVRLALYYAASKVQKALRPTIDFLGAFCSWDVLTVALIMIQLEMPSITSTIKQDDKCQEADPEHGRTCIEVEFNALDTFLVIVVSFFILVMASGISMSLASSDDEQPLLQEDGKRYEYGEPIPQERRYLPLQQQKEEDGGGNPPDNGLEQIVFV